MHTLEEIISRLEVLAPTYLAEKWDNVGLLVGSKKQPIKKILCALDINLAVVKEAISNEVDCIITHHPFIFKPLNKLDFDTPKGKLIQLLIQNNIAVYSMHTNWDIAQGGINDLLSSAFGIEEAKPLEITKTNRMDKLVIYAPKNCEEALREIIIQHNTCTIGNYKGCTFVTEGTGSFVPLEGSNPYIGKQDVCELVDEIKIECMVNTKDIAKLMKEVAKVHPYEEIAYDIYALDHLKTYEGIGRYGSIKGISLEELVIKTKQIFNIPYVRVVGQKTEMIQHLAICSGSGSEFIAQAARVAEVYITGDVKFHEGQMALEEGLTIIDVGHYASENKAIPFLRDYLKENFATLEVCCSSVDGEVFQIL
ncbi:MAG: Nif3-like dinuclear metal center hexameric protein [Cellulosilyticaceae bacterium]